MNKDLGERIRKIRMTKGMSQTTFSRHIGNMAVSTISAYEKGSLVPQDEVLGRIAELAGISKDDLLLGGIRFEEVIGEKAAQISNRKRIRSDSKFDFDPSAGDIQTLIERLNGFQEFIGDVTERLTKQDEQADATKLTDTEKKLLEAFRQLPANKQKRILEDTIEWAKALRETVSVNIETIQVLNKSKLLLETKK